MRKSNKIAKTTIIDIARASGVSVSTVSRIINDNRMFRKRPENGYWLS